MQEVDFTKNLNEKNNYTKYYSDLIIDIGINQSQSSFKLLYQEFYPRIKSYLRSLKVDPEHIEDLAQDVMGGIWKKSAQYDPKKSAPVTWIFTITRNRFIDAHIRKKHYNFTQEDACFFMNDIPNPYQNLERININTHLLDAVKKLPEDQLMLVKMAYFEEKAHAEIADVTSIPLGTVKSKLRTALKTLRKYMTTNHFK